MAIVHDHASYTIHNRNNPYNKCVCTTTEMYKFVCHFLLSDIRYVFNTIFKKKKITSRLLERRASVLSTVRY